MRDNGVQIESWEPFAEGRNNLFTDPVLTEIGTRSESPWRSPYAPTG
jgi:2,5-diketo-D-gluconate reductase A